MKQPSKFLKQRARMTLLGKYFPSVCVVFAASLISLILTYLLDISGFSPLGDPMRQLSFWLMSAVILLLDAVLSIGLTRYFFQMTLGQPFVFRDLFYGFTNNADRFIIAAALRYGLLALGWVPAGIWYFRMPVLLDAGAFAAGSNPPCRAFESSGAALLWTVLLYPSGAARLFSFGVYAGEPSAHGWTKGAVVFSVYKLSWVWAFGTGDHGRGQALDTALCGDNFDPVLFGCEAINFLSNMIITI